MRHRIPLLSTGIILGLLTLGTGSAQAQDSAKPGMSSKTLQKQCLSIAQRDSARDNSNMAAPAPTVSDSLRAVCDSVNAANPEFKAKMKNWDKNKAKDKAKNYPDTSKPAEVMPPTSDSTGTSSTTAGTPPTGVSPNISATPATTAPPAVTATPAATAAPATPADPNKPTDGTSSTTTPQ